MRKLFSILNLILCFELIVSPLAPSLSFISVAKAEGCPAGLVMDNTLNRCLTTAQQANVINATAACNGDVACYRENAQKAFQEKVNAGDAPERKKENKFVSTIATTAVMTGTLAAVYGMMSSKAKCTSPSYWAMIAAGAAVVGGEIMANMGHKKRLKKIKEDWGKIVNPEQASGDKDKEREASIEAQSQAFEMLAQSEDSLAKAAKLKKNFYMIATAAYAAAVVISLMEMSTNKSLKAASIAANKASMAGQVPAYATLSPTAQAAQLAAAELDIVLGAEEATDPIIDTAPAPVATAKAAASVSTLSAAVAAVSLAATENAAAAAAMTSVVPATAALHATAVSTSGTAATAAASYLTHTKTVLCIPLGGGIVQLDQENSNSIFAQYTSTSTFDIRQEIQSQYNLANSDNFASFIINQKEMNGELLNPLEEYASYKASFSEMNDENRTAFEIFKATSMSFMNNLNPISDAYADEVVQNLPVAEEASGSSSASTGALVQTNAAKTYREDEAKGPDLLGLGFKGLVAGVLVWKTALGGKLIKYSGRAVYSGIMAGVTLLVANHAGKQAEASEERAALLRKMKEEFNLASGAVNSCKSEDRSDPGKPNCYCYTPENQRNNNRGNSAVCQKLWAGKNLTPGKYYGTADTSSKVCITNSGKADSACACKATKSCMKVGLNGISGLNAGTMSMLGQSLAPLNGVANGSIDAANVNAGALENQASRLNLLAKELEKNKAFAGYRKNKDKISKAIMADLNKIGAGISPSGLSASNSGFNMPSNPADASKMLEKELENSNIPASFDGGDTIATPANIPPEQALEFGMTEDQLAEQEGQIAEVMNQDLDYGGNDINQGSKTNIFDVLSNRYQRSGMRRLFDEKGTTEAEKPATTEINQ